jgi:hypothetical protein
VEDKQTEETKRSKCMVPVFDGGDLAHVCRRRKRHKEACIRDSVELEMECYKAMTWRRQLLAWFVGSSELVSFEEMPTLPTDAFHHHFTMMDRHRRRFNFHGEFFLIH